MLRPSTNTCGFLRLPRAILGACIIVGLLVVGAPVASAVDYTWNVAGGGSWGTSTNWTPNGVPGSGDTVTIGTPTWGSTITLDGNRSIVSLTLTCANDHTLAQGTSGSLTLTSTGTAINESGGGRPTISCPVVLGASQTWASANGSAPSLTGAVSGAFTLTTTGDWRFTGSNSWTSLASSSGSIESQSASSLSTGTVSNSCNQLYFTTATNTTYANAFVLSANASNFTDIHSQSVNTTLTGVISGTTSGTTINFNVTGGGSLTLGGASANTWTSNTARVYQGTVYLAKSGALGAVTTFELGVPWIDAVTPTLLFSSGGLTCDRPINTSGDNASSATPSTTLPVLGGTHTSGTSTFSGAMTLYNDLTMQQAGGGRTNLTGIVAANTGSNPVIVITKTGTGTVGLSGNNTFTQAVSVSAGTLVAGANNAFGTSAGGVTVASNASVGFEGGITYSTAEPLTINGVGAASDGAVVNISGTNSFAGALTLASAASVGSQAGTLTLSGTVANGGFLLTAAGAGSLVSSGAISGTGGLTKTGTGTATLSSVSNTYSGGTTVAAGTLLANNSSGSGTGSGAVSVSAGATLGGSGTISGAITVANTAVLSPGASAGAVGTLTLSAASPITANANATLAIDVNGATADRLTCSAGSGSLSLGNLALTISSTTPTAGSFTLISYSSGSITGTFASVSGVPAGYVLVYSARSVSLVAGKVLLAWDLGTGDGSQASASATTVATGIQSSTITRGAGSSSQALAAFSGRGAMNTRDWYGANLAAAKTANEYLQTTIVPVAGWSASLSSVTITTYQQNVHPESTVVGEYSLDGFATAGITIGTANPITSGWSGGPTAFDLSGIAALQGVTTTVTFRFWAYGFASFEDKGFGQVSGANDDVAVIGSTVSLDTSGANEVWTGAGGDSNFATDYNWSDNSAPNSGDNVSFPDVTNQTVTMSAPATVGTITFNAADAYTVAGASALTLGGTVTQSGAGTVAISAPVATGNAARTLTGAGVGQVTLSGVISGTGLITVAGGSYRFTNAGNTFTGGTSTTGGTLTAESTAGKLDIKGNSGTSQVGTSATTTINGGTMSLLAATTVQTAVVTTWGSPRTFVFGSSGGTIAIGSPLDPLLNGESYFLVTNSAAVATPAIFTYGTLGSATDAWNWAGNNLFYSTAGATTGALRVEVSNGATMLMEKNTLGQTAFVGHSGGAYPTSALATTTGRVIIQKNGTSGPLTWTADGTGFTFSGTLQVLLTKGIQTLGSNVTIAAGTVGFQGHSVNVASPGTFGTAIGSHTLTIANGATAIMDLRFLPVAFYPAVGGLVINDSTALAGGGTLSFRQTIADTGVSWVSVTGDITATGTAASEAIIDIQLAAGSSAGLLDLGTPGVSGCDLIVNGTTTGGLKVQGTSARLTGALTAARLAAVTGSGGYLSIAPSDATFTMPASSQWSDTDIGLRVVDSHGSGTDLALSDAAATWARPITIDSGAELGVGHATTATTISGGIAGAGGLTKTGAASVTLSVANTYSGATVVSVGALRLTNSSGSGTGTSATVSVASGAALEGTGSCSSAVSIAAGGALLPATAGTTGTLSTGACTLAGSLAMDIGSSSDLLAVTGNLTLGGTLDVSVASGFGPGTYTIATYSGSLSGSFSSITMPSGSSGSIDTATAGVVKLVVTVSTYTWNTPAGGSWNTSTNWSPNGIPASYNPTVVATINATTTIDLNGNAFTSGLTISTNNDFTLAQGSSGSLSLGSNGVNRTATANVIHLITCPITFTADQVWTVSSANGQTKLSGVVSGGYALTKAGVGILAYQAINNLYSGTTTIRAGTFRISDQGSAGTSSTAIIMGDGSTLGSDPVRLQFDYSGTFSRAIDATYALGVASGGRYVLAAFTNRTVVLSGAVNWSAPTAVVRRLDIAAKSGATLTVSGLISSGANAGTLGVNTNGEGPTGGAVDGVVRFANTGNTYTTGTVFAQGTFRILDAIAASGASIIGTQGLTLGDGSNTLYAYYVNVDASVTCNRSMATGGSGGIAYLGSSQAGVNPIWSGTISLVKDLTMSVPATSTMTLSNGISGAGGFTQADAGTTIISGTKSYTGTTTISAGRLQVDGSTATSAHTLSGGILCGSGGTVGAISGSSGSVAPGTAAAKGILNGSTANLSAGAGLTIRAAALATAGTDFDRLALSGAITLGGTSALTLDLSSLATTGTATGIVTCSGTPVPFGSVTVTNNTNSYRVSVAYTAGNINLVVAAAGAQTLYWNPVSGSTNGNLASNWTSDQAGTARATGLATTDNVSFNGSGATADNACTLTAGLTCASFDCTGYTGTLTDAGYTLAVNGNATFVSGMTLLATGTVQMNSGGTLTGGGRALFNVGSTGGTLVFGDDFTIAGVLSDSATLNWNGKTLTLSGAGKTHAISTATLSNTTGGKLIVTGAGTAITWPGTAGASTDIPNLDLRADVSFDRAAANICVINGPGSPRSDFSISAGVTLTLGSNLTLNFNSPTGFSPIFTAGAGSVVAGTGTFKWTGSNTGSNFPSPDPSFTANVICNGSTATASGYSIPAGLAFGRDLTFTNNSIDRTLTFAGSSTIAGNFLLDLNTSGGAGTMTVPYTAGTTITISGNYTYQSNNAAGIAHVINSTQAAADFVIGGNLDLSDTDGNLTVRLGAGTWQVGGATVNLTGADTFTHNSGTFELVRATGAATVTSAGKQFSTLKLSPTNSISLSDAANANDLVFNTINAITLSGASGITLRSGNLTRNDITGTEGIQTLSAPVTLGANGVWTINSTDNYLDVTGAIGGGFSLQKAGAGTVVLSGQNTYSGGTTVSAGILRLSNGSGSGAGSGAVAVNSGGIVEGTGSCSGAVTVASGGSIRPATAGTTGTLSTGTCVLGGGLAMDLGTSSDRLSVTGNLTLGGTVSITAGSGFGSGTYTIATYSGSCSGVFTSLVMPAGYGGSVSYSGGNVTLTVTTATGFTWTGAVSSNWNTAGNWAGGVVPGSADAVSFTQSAPPNQPDLSPLSANAGNGSWSFSSNGSDASGNGRTATLSGDATWSAAGQSGNGLTMSGAGYAVIGGASITAGANVPTTVSAWVKTTDTRGPIVSLRSGGGGSVFDLCIGTAGVTTLDGRLVVIIRQEVSSWQFAEVVGSRIINDNVWHHVAATRNADGSITTFVDGIQDGSAGATNSSGSMLFDTNAVGAERVWIPASYLTTAEQYLAGSIDEVRIQVGNAAPAVAGITLGASANTTTITSSAGLPLQLGTSGITLTAALNDLTLACPVRVSASQTWNLATARTVICSQVLGLDLGSNRVLTLSDGTLSTTGLVAIASSGASVNVIDSTATTTRWSCSGGINTSGGHNQIDIRMSNIDFAASQTVAIDTTTSTANLRLLHSNSGGANGGVNIGSGTTVTVAKGQLRLLPPSGAVIGGTWGGGIFDGSGRFGFQIPGGTTQNLPATAQMRFNGPFVISASHNTPSVPLWQAPAGWQCYGDWIISNNGLGNTVRTLGAANIGGAFTIEGNTTGGAGNLDFKHADGATVTVGAILYTNNIGSGTFTVGAANGTGNITATGNIDFSDGDGTKLLGVGSGTWSAGGNITLAGLDGAADQVLLQAGTTTGRIAATGNLTLGGNLIVNAGVGFGVGTYTIATYSGSLAGSFASLSMPSGFSGSIDTSTAGQVKLEVLVLEVWTGAGGNPDWNTNGNWSDGSFPASGSAISFPDVANQTVTMNVPATVGPITFNAPDAYVINPSSVLTLGGTVTQSGAGTVAVSAPIALGAAARTFQCDGAGKVTVTGVISGGPGGAVTVITKAGSGTLFLSSATNTFGSGGVIVLSGGRLEFDGDASLGNSGNDVTVSNDAVLAYTATGVDWAPGSGRIFTMSTGGGSLEVTDAARSATFGNANVLSTAGSTFRKRGPGTLVISASQSTANTGAVVLLAGTTTFSHGAAVATSGNVTLGDTSGSTAATLYLDFSTGTSGATFPITVAAGSSGTKTLGSSQSGGSAGFRYEGAIVLNDSVMLYSAMTGTGTLAASDKGFAMRGGVSGSGGITLTGGGYATFTGSTPANTYTGLTYVQDGTLYVTRNNGSNSIVCIPGDLTIGDGSGTDTVVGPSIYGDAISDTGTLTIASNGVLDFATNSSREATGPLVMAGGATVTTAALVGSRLILAGNVSTTASASSAIIGSASGGLGLGGATRTFTVADGAAAIDLDVTSIITDFDLAGGGVSGLTKAGTGLMRISGANIYTGATTVNAGTLIITGSTVAASAVTVVGGTLGGTGTIAGATTVQAGATLAPGSTTASAGTLTISRASATALSLAGTTILDFELGTVSDKVALTGASANLTLDGTVNVTAGAGFAAGTYPLITYTGTCTDVTLAVGTLPASYAATVNINTGTSPRQVELVMTGIDYTWNNPAGGSWNTAANWTPVGIPGADSQATIATINSAATITLDGAAAAKGVTISATNAFTLATGSSGSLSVGSSGITRSSTASVVHTIACPLVMAADQVWTVSSTNGRLDVSGALSGAYALTKAGAGSATLSGANTNSGGTTVSAGTLLITNSSGSGCGSGAVSVSAGATLGGSGTISGVVTAANTAVFSPGASAGAVGTLTLSAASPITASANTTLAIEINGATADRLTCSAGSGSLSLSNLALVITSTSPSASSYTLLSYAGGSLTGSFASISGLPTGYGVLVGATAVTLIQDTDGVNEVWTGAGVDAKWNTNANWNDGTFPDSGDNISFPDVTNQTVEMNVAAMVGTITFNAADAYAVTVTGAGALTLGGTVTQSGSGPVAISAPVATGGSARTLTGVGSGAVTVSGVISGSGLQTFAGATWVLTNAANSFSGGITIAGGTVQAQPTGANAGLGITTGSATSYLGNVNVGTVTIDGGRLLISPTGTGTIGNGGNAWPTIALGTGGGTFDLASAPFDTTYAVGNNVIFPFAVTAASGTPAVVAHGYHSGDATSHWLRDNGWLGLSTLTSNGALTLSLTSGAGAYWNSSSRTFAGTLLLSGHGNGSAAANATAVAGNVTSTSVGRLGLFSVSSDTWTTGTIRFANAMQVALLGSASANTLDGALQVDANGAVAFAGSDHGSLSALVVGASTARTLTIQTGGIAVLGFGAGSAGSRGGATLNARPLIAAGGTFRPQAGAATDGNNRINGDITGQGSGAADAVFDLQQDVGTGNNQIQFATPDGVTTNSGADVIVDGTGTGGLVVRGTVSRLAALLGASRLVAVTGSGGYLGFAATDAAFTMPSSSQWSDTDIGLRVLDSYGSGTDLALSDAAATWARPITIDSGAVLGVGHVSTATTITGGIAGAGGLIKTGAATTTLATTACAFTGAVTVSAGTLAIDTTCSGGGALSVQSGATLAGSGSFAGAVTAQNGGIIAPAGATAGTLTLTKASATALALNASSVLSFDLGTSSDLIACSGASAALILDGTVNVTGGAGFAAGTFTIITYTGALADNTLAVGTMPAGYTATVDTSVAGQVRLVCSTIGYTARETGDTDGDGRIDQIRITTTGTLNDDFTGFTATVAGYVVTGTSTGGTANDNEFFVLLTESGSADSAATPSVRVTANTTLRPAAGGGTYPTEGSGTTPVDRAKPVLIAADWTDGDTNGVDAGDGFALTFSETVSTSAMVVADLGLPVASDSLATSTIANQSSATVAVVLVGAPQFTPAGAYASGATLAGNASGLYLAVGTRISDAVGNTGYVQNAAAAVDIGPSTAAVLSVAWETGTNPKSWALGTVAAGATANTVATPDLRVRNAGNGAVQLLIKTTASAPSLWAPGGAAGANTYLMKCDNAGTASGGPTNPVNYAMTLTLVNQSMTSFVYSGAIADFELYFAAPSSITIGGGLEQIITVTVTAQIAP